MRWQLKRRPVLAILCVTSWALMQGPDSTSQQGKFRGVGHDASSRYRNEAKIRPSLSGAMIDVPQFSAMMGQSAEATCDRQ